MKKLVLEMTMLKPLSSRGIEALMQQTLPASEIRCGTGWARHVPPKASADTALLPSQQSLPYCLNLCGFAAMMRLGEDELVMGLSEKDEGMLLRALLSSVMVLCALILASHSCFSLH